MPSKKTLNAANLEALGSGRLAELLLEISQGDAAAKRRLRLELAGAESPIVLAQEIRKRLTTIARSRGGVDWQGVKAVAADLEAQRRAIAGQVAPRLPDEGLELMWRFLDLSGPVLARCEDGNGMIIDVFRAALGDLAVLARMGGTGPKQLGDQAFRLLNQNDQGQFEGLIATLAPALGPVGLEHLKQRVIALSKEPVRKPPDTERRVIAWGPGGPVHADEVAERTRAFTAQRALREIADAQGDVDAFIAQYDAKTRKMPVAAAAIAQRLLAAGRAEEAARMLDAAVRRRHDPDEAGWEPAFEWEDARIAVSEALGRGDEAQTMRWSCFEAFLSARHLREYLKHLPDFDDAEAEDRAFGHAERFGDLSRALWFLVSWPAPDKAARVVVRRAKELDGDRYEILTPAAKALADRHPLAATLMLRAMIDFALTHARSSRYGHAARHLRTCADLAPAIQDFGAFETHDAYAGRLRREHGRKAAFWSLTPEGEISPSRR